MSVGVCIIEAMKKTNEEIIAYLIADIQDMIPRQIEHDGDSDGFGDYLQGCIERSQSVLRMLGVPSHLIPTIYGVDELD
jgi:hypothetical protein